MRQLIGRQLAEKRHVRINAVVAKPNATRLDFFRGAAYDDEPRLRMFIQHIRHAVEQQVDALINRERAAVADEQLVRLGAQPRGDRRGALFVRLDERRWNVKNVKHRFARRGGAGLIAQPLAGADDRVSVAHDHMLDPPVQGHHHIAQRTSLIRGGVGMFFENHRRTAEPRRDPRDHAGILDAVHHGISLLSHQTQCAKQNQYIKNKFVQRRPDRKLLGSERIAHPVNGHAGRRPVFPHRHGEQIDFVAQFSQRQQIKAQPDRRSAPLEIRHG